MPVDLRSDTVTRPTPAMREAMAAAPVGDDQFGEDPSVNLLQERVAALLGKEAGLFVPTGHMANQLALLGFTRPGDEVVVGRETHAVWHEIGAGAANAGVQFREVGEDGTFTAEELVAAIKPRGHLIFPPTTLVEVEDTQNRMGGLVWDRAALAAPFDLATIALSKGLGGPAGSVLAGRRADVDVLVRERRRLGGAMRQSGILAAAGLHALDHHVARLADDHANARLIGERLAASEHVELDLDRLETNIVVFHLREGAPDAAEVVARAAQEDVLVLAFAERTVRAVTHLDVDRDACATAAEVLADAVVPLA